MPSALAEKPVFKFELEFKIVREQSYVPTTKAHALVILSSLKEKKDATCVVS